MNRTLVILIVLGLVIPRLADAGYRFSTVIIDAGHGGHDRGGIPGQSVPEKTMALDVARRLQHCLQDRGYRTVMTRNSDSFVSLGRRVAIANSQRNAIFVSIHFNAARRRGARGFETYYYTSRSAALASNIHRQILRSCRTENRGVRRRGFFVIRKTRMPAVLVECGFLTNPDEARLISNAAHRQRLAHLIAEAIARQNSGS
jgi:N-acetylmuramoyl-L-alanine amidase